MIYLQFTILFSGLVGDIFVWLLILLKDAIKSTSWRTLFFSTPGGSRFILEI